MRNPSLQQQNHLLFIIFVLNLFPFLPSYGQIGGVQHQPARVSGQNGQGMTHNALNGDGWSGSRQENKGQGTPHVQAVQQPAVVGQQPNQFQENGQQNVNGGQSAWKPSQRYENGREASQTQIPRNSQQQTDHEGSQQQQKSFSNRFSTNSTIPGTSSSSQKPVPTTQQTPIRSQLIQANDQQQNTQLQTSGTTTQRQQPHPLSQLPAPTGLQSRTTPQQHIQMEHGTEQVAGQQIPKTDAASTAMASTQGNDQEAAQAQAQPSSAQKRTTTNQNGKQNEQMKDHFGRQNGQSEGQQQKIGQETDGAPKVGGKTENGQGWEGDDEEEEDGAKGTEQRQGKGTAQVQGAKPAGTREHSGTHPQPPIGQQRQQRIGQEIPSSKADQARIPTNQSQSPQVQGVQPGANSVGGQVTEHFGKQPLVGKGQGMESGLEKIGSQTNQSSGVGKERTQGGKGDQRQGPSQYQGVLNGTQQLGGEHWQEKNDQGTHQIQGVHSSLDGQGSTPGIGGQDETRIIEGHPNQSQKIGPGLKERGTELLRGIGMKGRAMLKGDGRNLLEQGQKLLEELEGRGKGKKQGVQAGMGQKEEIGQVRQEVQHVTELTAGNQSNKSQEVGQGTSPVQPGQSQKGLPERERAHFRTEQPGGEPKQKQKNAQQPVEWEGEEEEEPEGVPKSELKTQNGTYHGRKDPKAWNGTDHGRKDSKAGNGTDHGRKDSKAGNGTDHGRTDVKSRQEPNSGGVEGIGHDWVNKKKEDMELGKAPNTTTTENPEGFWRAAGDEQQSSSTETTPTTVSTTTSSSSTATMRTTTTQDPKIKQQLERAGTPDVLKLFVPPKPPPLPESAKKAFEDKCAGGKCLVQKPEFIQQKAMVKEETEQVEQRLNPGKSAAQVKQEIQTRMTKTQQLKKELMKNAGLEGQVEPADNGVFGHDQLLTEDQANELISELGRQRNSGRKKRAGNALFEPMTSSKRWDPKKEIPFMFDKTLADEDKKAVREAVTEIQSKSCLKFTEVNAKPSGSHLYYTKIANPTFCGLSYVGRVEPANIVYLSFMCGHPAGVAMHETMHALGFQHEQLRFDRDQFLTIQWENVNPQQLDFFALSDITKFSSYGVKYDYASIMQYAGTIAASGLGKKTMVPKNSPETNEKLMGQREGLHESDVEALKKMYCQPGCDDKLSYCGIWATMNLCDPRMWRRGVVHEWIVSNCQKSCNKCGEKIVTIEQRPF